MNGTPITTVEALVDLLTAGARAQDGHDGDDVAHIERVDLLAHALQCGHVLAERFPDDIELHVAGLIHDIGHQLVPGDDMGHGIAGGHAVRGLLGDRVAALVELHVPAKRFLVTVDPDYGDALSPTSVHTLGNQGGRMTDAEVAAFRAHPDAGSAVELRRADEAAKVHGRAVPGLDQWMPVLERVAAS